MRLIKPRITQGGATATEGIAAIAQRAQKERILCLVSLRSMRSFAARDFTDDTDIERNLLCEQTRKLRIKLAMISNHEWRSKSLSLISGKASGFRRYSSSTTSTRPFKHDHAPIVHRS